MQGASFGLPATASSAAAFLADGKTVTLSATVSVPWVFWNCGLLTDGGFSAMSEVETPTQWASCVSPTVLLLVFGFLVDFHPAGMSDRVSRSLRAWVREASRSSSRPPLSPTTRAAPSAEQAGRHESHRGAPAASGQR